MKGTIFSVTVAMRFRPPTMTRAHRMRITTPDTQVGTPNTDSILPAMELTWVMLPMPKEARKQNTEKAAARMAPICLQPFFAPRPSRR